MVKTAFGKNVCHKPYKPKYYELIEDIAVKVYYNANITRENKERLDDIVKRKGIEFAQFTIDNDRFKLKLN